MPSDRDRRKHEDCHRRVLRKLGVAARDEYEGGVLVGTRVSGHSWSTLTPTQRAAVYLAAHEQGRPRRETVDDRQLAEQELRAVPRKDRGGARREAQRLAR